jgi:hypothetical protein
MQAPQDKISESTVYSFAVPSEDPLESLRPPFVSSYSIMT